MNPLAVSLGFLLDGVLGDPHWLWHPICAIGNGIAFLEKHLRKIFPKSKVGEQAAGILMWWLVCISSFAIPFCILWLAGLIHPILRFVIETFMCYQIFARKSLYQESMKVAACLQKHDLEAARLAVSYIVGRDTQALSEEGVIKAAVETVAENASDGIIAPMLYLFLGGAPLGFLYKAVNTMDSMVGYKNDKYLYFGRFAAKMDDIFNWIPARFSAVCMILMARFVGQDSKNALHIWKRDRRNHASPNSAQTESVCAGALHVQLAGNAYYFGKLYEKPYIGDADRPIASQDILRINQLTAVASSLALVIGAGVCVLIQFLR